MNILFFSFFSQITPSRGDKDGVAEDGSASKTLNRSSSFLFESLYDSSLLAGLSPPQDPSEEEEPCDQEIRLESPAGLKDRRRRSELLANQEAEEQEAICWGESSFSLSEWGDSLLVGEHFLERQCLLKCAERSLKQHSGRHDKDQQVSGGQQTSESRSDCIMVEPEHTVANTTPSKADHDRSGYDGKTSGVHEKQMQAMEGVCSKIGLFQCVQNAPSSALYCSPGLQEIFDRWPSMSEQPCPHAATNHPANTAEVRDLPQAPREVTRRRGTEQAAAPESGSPKERLSGCEPEDATERPGSASDLIPPTQERPPVTPRLKLTTSSVQSPLAAPPQSAPSTLLRPQPAVTKRPKSQSGRRENLLEEQADSTSDGHRGHQRLNSFPFPNPGSSASLKQHNDQSVSPSRDCAPPSSPRPELPSDEESPVADKGFTLQLSQDASLCSSGSFSIIDVASDRRLFETFINEWRTKERYSLSLACEKKEPRQQPDEEIGWQPKKGNSNILK